MTGLIAAAREVREQARSRTSTGPWPSREFSRYMAEG
jgi:hypothetical protein